MLLVATNALKVVIIAGLTSGCAFGTRNVNLTYDAPQSIGTQASRGTVAVARFTDARTPDLAVGQQVGQMRNGFGAPTASVNANQNPVIWVSDSLARALASQGYTVERVESAKTSGDLPVVGGSVTAVFADVFYAIEAEVKAQVTVDRDGQALVSTECVGKDSQMTWTGSADDYQDRLNGAMRQFVDTCVPKLLPYLAAGS